MGFWNDLDKEGPVYAFQQRAQRKALEKEAREAAEKSEQEYNGRVNAVFAALHDEEKLAAALEVVPDKSRFFKEQTIALLSQIIDFGKVEPFRAALKYCNDDPNVVMSVVVGSHYNGSYTVNVTENMALLNYALFKRSHDIAQELAAHPNMSIEAAGKAGGKTFEDMIGQAKDIGMSDVHETLKKRAAEVYRRRAATLEATPVKL